MVTDLTDGQGVRALLRPSILVPRTTEGPMSGSEDLITCSAVSTTVLGMRLSIGHGYPRRPDEATMDEILASDGTGSAGTPGRRSGSGCVQSDNGWRHS